MLVWPCFSESLHATHAAHVLAACRAKGACCAITPPLQGLTGSDLYLRNASSRASLQPDRTAFVAPVVVKPASDPRLQRLAQRRREPGSDSDDDSEGAGDRRRAAARRHATIAAEAERAAPGAGSSEDEDSDADEEGGDDEDIAARRAAVIARQATRSPRAGNCVAGGARFANGTHVSQKADTQYPAGCGSSRRKRRCRKLPKKLKGKRR